MTTGMRALCSMLALGLALAACRRPPAQTYPDGSYPQAYPPGYAAGVFGGSWVTRGGAMTLQEQNGTVTGTLQSGSLQGSVQGVVRGGQLELLLAMSDGSSGRFVATSDGTQLTINTGGMQPLVFTRAGGAPAAVAVAPVAPPAPAPPAPFPVSPSAPSPAPSPAAPQPHPPAPPSQAKITGCFRSSIGSGAVLVERTLYFDGAGRFTKQGAAGRGAGGTYAVTGKRVRLQWNDGTTEAYDLVHDHGTLGALQSGSTTYQRCR